jgi:hypothetical protein
MVTRRMLPWFGMYLMLGACGGVAELGGAGGDSPNAKHESANSARPADPKSPPGKGDGAGSTTSGSMTSEGGGTTSSGGDPGLASLGGAHFGGGPPGQYSGSGFVVHEWGTDTIVVGSDGSLQRGLHHEEEDLPGFVYDRIKAAALIGGTFSPSVTIKMETPVTYFYSSLPRTVHAGVAFPKGVLTQWYPGATSFLPPVAAPSAMLPEQPLSYADPVLDPTFPFMSDMCRVKFGTIGAGQLDWGNVNVLPRDGNVTQQLPPAPLDKFSWSYARDVASNLVQTANGETERFLFYRGLGDFDLPVKINVTGLGIAGLGGNPVVLKNQFSEAIGSVFMMNVGDNEAVFSEFPKGIPPGGELSDKLPLLYGTRPLDAYAEQLSEAVTGALDGTGLYHDEAVAMVNTWKRQWFRTPGVRLLYIIPQTWTDASIPLTIEPKPDATLRVMLIRVEIITPEQEAEDVAALGGFAAKGGLGQAHFASLGRFAEPRLRRALALAPNVDAQAYLAQITTANTSVGSGE